MPSHRTSVNRNHRVWDGWESLLSLRTRKQTLSMTIWLTHTGEQDGHVGIPVGCCNSCRCRGVESQEQDVMRKCLPTDDDVLSSQGEGWLVLFRFVDSVGTFGTVLNAPLFPLFPVKSMAFVRVIRSCKSTVVQGICIPIA